MRNPQSLGVSSKRQGILDFFRITKRRDTPGYLRRSIIWNIPWGRPVSTEPVGFTVASRGAASLVKKRQKSNCESIRIRCLSAAVRENRAGRFEAGVAKSG